MMRFPTSISLVGCLTVLFLLARASNHHSTSISESFAAAAAAPEFNEYGTQQLVLRLTQLAASLENMTSANRRVDMDLRKQIKRSISQVDDILLSFPNYLQKPLSRDKSITPPKRTKEGRDNPDDDLETERSVRDVLTLAYNFVHYTKTDIVRVLRLVMMIRKKYPNISVVAAAPHHLKAHFVSTKNTRFLFYNQAKWAETKIWNNLISYVRTEFVFIGRNVVHFSQSDRLEALVSYAAKLKAYFVGTATRALGSGEWRDGCEQTTLRYYVMIFKRGYDRSIGSCLVCHHTESPFVIRTKLLQLSIPFPPDMATRSAFTVWFLKLKQMGKLGVVCPESMATVSDESYLPTARSEWYELSKVYQVETIYLADGRTMDMGSSESGISIPCSRQGLIPPHHCQRKLVAMVMVIMNGCQKFGMICTLWNGTLLGALKFGTELPWEVGGSVIVHSHNFSNFGSMMRPYVKSYLEHELNLVYLGGRYRLNIANPPGLSVDIYPHNMTSISVPPAHQLSLTKMHFDGQLLTAPASPGLLALDKYGEEFLHHSLFTKKVNSSSLIAKDFPKCPQAGNHACLDALPTDGTLHLQAPAT